MIRRLAVAASVVLAIAACSSDDDDDTFPKKRAPPSRHAALIDAVADDARSFTFANGDWGEDLGDATFYGLAWLARRGEAGRLDGDAAVRRDAALARARTLLEGNLLEGDVQDHVMAALGVIEYIAATRDRTLVPVLDDFVDRLSSLTHTLGDYLDIGADQSWALRTYGPTAVTALVGLVLAQEALLVGGDTASARLDAALAIDAKLRERAYTDLVDVPTGRGVRGYAFAPGEPALFDYPNLAMLILKTRLYRLTKDEVFRLEARGVYAALQPLKLTDVPARYASPYAKASLGIDARDLSTLSSQNYLALGLLLLFEITGDARFVDEADRVVDAIAAMRGPWCTSQVAQETPGTPERCTTGLLHHTVNGRLALPEDGTLFCSGCNLQTLYVTGYRRALAGEGY